MLYKTEALSAAARRHAQYYLNKLTKLKAAYQSTPESIIPDLRKIMPQVQQAHSLLFANYEVNPSDADMLVDMTVAAMGCVRMLVAAEAWGRWLRVGVEAATARGRHVDHLDFTIERGVHAFRQGDLETAWTFAQIGEETATSLAETSKRAQCTYLQALVCQKRGETKQAQVAIAKAQQDYEAANDQAGIGKVRSFMAQAAIAAMDYERAQQLLEQNIQLWQVMGDKRQMAVERYQLGVMLSNQVRYAESDTVLHDARETFQQLADRRYEAYSLQILSANAMERGFLDEALAYIEDALKLFLTVNDQRGVAGALNYMGRIYDKQGDYDRAIDAHQRATDVASAIDYRFAITDAHRSLCEIHLKTDNLNDARDAIYQAITVGETSGNQLLILAVLTSAVGVLVADQRPSIAADVACTILQATDETLILNMLEPHSTSLNTDAATPMSVAEANTLVKNLYQ